MQQYLATSAIINWQHPNVLALAKKLTAETVAATARNCFEWVRDEIRHSWDYQMNPVTCTASEVLSAGTGYCFAKSHLLAALLRANDIPAGLCYQRFSRDGNGAPYILHGLNAAFLPDHGWYRMDARGNKAGVDAQFTPPLEQLAFPLTPLTRVSGEADLPAIYSDPLPNVVRVLQTYTTYDAVSANLPDFEPDSL
ncbi:MAG: transglutaminase family protein [Anaerolineae bacterium]|nr:transglutaminase family protein [Anaerolineae bacterium]